jgi:hypothetical protein
MMSVPSGGSDRVTSHVILIIASGFDPVAIAPGTDIMPFAVRSRKLGHHYFDIHYF